MIGRTALATALAATLLAGPLAAQEVTLRLHHILPAQAYSAANFIQPWADRVMEQSQGRIEVQVYPAMSLGGTPPQLYDQARDGVVDIVWTLAGYTPGRFPLAEIFDLPFIAANAEQGSRAAWRFFDAHLREEFADIHPIAVHVHGPGHLHISAPAVRTPDDLTGRSVRGGTRMVNRLLDRLGATPVGMPVSQVSEALSRNVIDGTVIPWEVTQAFRVAELTGTHTEFLGDRGLYTTFFLFAMNPETYAEMPQDLRAVIDANSGMETSAWLGRVMDEADAPARDAAMARGNEIVTIEGAALEPWRAAAASVRAEWVDAMATRGVDAAALIADLERLMAEEVSR
ncbi:MAG: TRAP transporter substrate-binding protein [Pararhodobacter sp.]|nr:TRAP transporter substrate-binding protein [Pararhodobacter sp.]